MKHLYSAFRISLSMASLTLSVLLGAAALGLVPDRQGAVIDGRKTLAETIALQVSVAVQRQELEALESVLQALAERTPDLRSVAVRRTNGRLVTVVGPHHLIWVEVPSNQSTPTHIHLPISLNDQPWGIVELAFQPLAGYALGGYLDTSLFPLLAFVGAGSLVASSFYLWMVFRGILGGAIPRRVRKTLNTLAEGVLILDRGERIALANDAFARLVQRSTEDLEGVCASELPWIQPEPNDPPQALPWVGTIQEGLPKAGAVLGLRTELACSRTLSVNASPIFNDSGETRGVLATFDDLTVFEKKNVHLRRLLVRLRESQAQVEQQNQELKTLATRDPLTGCLNRRAFFSEFESQWNSAVRYSHPLSCVMMDVDRFKMVNDAHGHSTGDRVLQRVAETLRGAVRASDLVCRYGGEEFCILLPHTDIQEAIQGAERFRLAIANQPLGNIAVTASLGVSSLSFGAREPGELLDQADKALYFAKRTGRNRSIGWAPELAHLEQQVGKSVKSSGVRSLRLDVPIPFHAVTALLSALAYRDVYTAEHSRRVADLCVATANGLLSQSQCYVLEVAALLHDIGKLGIADAILLKPGPLTEREWKVIRNHERIGAQIITAAFTSAELGAITREHHYWYGGTPSASALPRGKDISLGARILAIADAYDAMASDRVYRKGIPREDAFAELRRCADVQFDPALVERFIEVVEARDDARTVPTLIVSKQTALRIGMQIEKLAQALDAEDIETLTLMAGQLRATAQEYGIALMAEAATQLEQLAASGSDWLILMQQALDLMELCRATYSSYVDTASSCAINEVPVAAELGA